MGSLRTRLGWTMAIGVFLITAVAGALVGYERWQEAKSSLPTTIELEAFRVSETASIEGLSLTAGLDGSVFAVLLDDEAETIATAGEVDDARIAAAESIWEETTEQDLIVSGYDPAGDEAGPRLFAAGVACTDQQLCDTVVVGATEPELLAYLAGRWFWLMVPALLAALAALMTGRWMVGRALAPVEDMRAELAEITASRLDRRVPVAPTGDELADLGMTVNSTLDRLQTSTEATTRFAADAAHELRSPLTGIRTALELRSGDDALLTGAIDEVDRATRLIDDLLVLARRDGSPPEPGDVDLDDLVRQDIAIARAANPAMTIDVDLAPVRLWSDGDALRRVVTNLVANACAYGTSTVAVTLAPSDPPTTTGQPGCTLLVEDDGPGVPPEDRDWVFERFARLDDSRARRSGGSGLGLAIAAELVADLGGSIAVEDSDLGGARFRLTLPARIPTRRPAPTGGG